MRSVKKIPVGGLAVPDVCKPEIALFEIALYRKKMKNLYRVLSPDEKERAKRFSIKSAREQFIVSRGMLRTMLGKRVGCDPRRLVFAYGPHGKPCLDAVLSGLKLKAPLHFSVSHSNGVVIIGIGICEVGADVEKKRKVVNVKRVAARILSPLELRAFQKLDVKLQHDVLLRIWTYKEAVIKALGCGFTMPVRSFQVWRSNPKKPLEFLERIRIMDRKIGRFDLESASIALPGDFVGAVSILYPAKPQKWGR